MTEEIKEQITQEEEEGILEPISEEQTPPSFEDDKKELAEEFPDLNGLDNLEEDERYCELRSLGLSPKEAILATRGQIKRLDNRSHLRTGVPRSARSPMGQMSRRQLEEAREFFSDLDDAEIQRLYKRVT